MQNKRPNVLVNQINRVKILKQHGAHPLKGAENDMKNNQEVLLNVTI